MDTEWLLDVRLRHSVPPVQYMWRIVRVEGWWLSGCCGSLAEHWWLKPEVSWVRLPVIAVLFTFLYFHHITSKFIYFECEARCLTTQMWLTVIIILHVSWERV